jgi:hypothetical protein
VVGGTVLVSDELRSIIENMRDQQTKVRIKTLYGVPDVGYITDVGEDYLTLRVLKNREGFSKIIMLEHIVTMDTNFVFK